MVNTKSNIMRLMAGLGLLGLASISQAAVVNVTGGGDALKNAWAAAANNDVLQINDSLTYNGGIYLDGKKVDIVAAVGQSPTIQPDGASSYIFQVSTTGAASQLGAVGMGQIIINTSSTITDVFRFLHNAPSKFVAQNLQINFAFSGYAVFPRDTTNGDIELTEVNITGNSNVADQKFVRVDGFNGRTVTFNRCDMRNVSRLALGSSSWAICGFGYTGGGTLNLNSCVIDSGNHSSIIRELILLDQGAGNGFTINIDNSFIQRRMAGNFQTFRIRASNINLNMTNSAMTNPADYRTLDLLIQPDNCNINLNHCDFVAFARNLSFESLNGGSLTVTNCNVVNLGGGDAGFYIVSDALFATRVSNYNNVFGAADAYGSMPQGANEILPPVDPAYADITNGDFRPGAASLTTAGQGGSAVGSNRSYANVVPVELSTFGVL